MMKTIRSEDYLAIYNDDQATKDAVFEKVIAFFKRHESFSGESICQCDEPMIDAPYFMAELADKIIKFDVKYF